MKCMVIQVKNKDFIMNMNKAYILFVLALFCAQGLWAKTFEADGIWYETTSTNTVRVVEEPVASGEGTSFSFRKCYEGDITIPVSRKYKEVVATKIATTT